MGMLIKHAGNIFSQTARAIFGSLDHARMELIQKAN